MNIRSLALTAALVCAPLCIAQTWMPAGWGGGGLYWAAAFHPAKDGTLYMAGDVLGVYKSENHGLTWRLINNGITGYEVLSLATVAAEPERLYAVTCNGISASANGGEKWETLPKSGPGALNLVCEKFKSIHCLAVDPAKPARLAFAAPDGRILESRDRGQTWAVLHQVKDGFGSSVAYRGGSLFAATSKGILLFGSGAAPPKTVHAQPAFALSFAASGRVGYAALAGKGIARTEDGGQTWRLTSLKPREKEEWIDVVVDPKNPLVAHAIGTVEWNGRFASTRDGGRTWTESLVLKGDALWNPTDLEISKAGPTGISMPRSLAINPYNGSQLFFAANWRPAFSADGGKTWEERSRGADISVVTDIYFHAGRAYVTAMDEGLFVSDNSSLGWRQIFPLRWSPEDSGHQWRVRAWDDGKQILSTGSPWGVDVNLAYRTLDGGATMVRVKDGLPAKRPTQNTIWANGYPRAMASHPANPYTVYLGIDGDDGGGIFKSSDGGWHWSRLANQPGNVRTFHGLAVDPTNPNRVYAGVCGDKGGVYKSEDGGGSWQNVFDQWGCFFNIHVASDGTLLAPGHQLYASSDQGKTWRQLTNFDEGMAIVGLETHPLNPKIIWFSRHSWNTTTRGGVYESTDGGASWREITGNIPNHRPTVLRYNVEKKELWAGGPGIFRLARH